MTRKTHRRPSYRLTQTYSLVAEMMASPTEPLSETIRTHQLTRMWGGLAAIESGKQPTGEDWRLCSDAVNLLETLVLHNSGHWLDCAGNVVQIADQSRLLMDAVTALAKAGNRQKTHGAIRMDGPGIQAVRAVLEDYAALLDALPARTVVKAHRQTERRIQAIFAGRKQPHDVVVKAVA